MTIIVAVFAMLAAVTVPASPPPLMTGTYGIGNASCGKWTQDLRDDPHGTARYMDISWLGGFITGMNASLRFGDITQGRDFPGMSAWVDNYCAGHPLENVLGASENLVVELVGTRNGAPSRP